MAPGAATGMLMYHRDLSALLFVIIGFVGYLTVTRKDVEEPAAARATRRSGHHRQEA